LEQHGRRREPQVAALRRQLDRLDDLLLEGTTDAAPKRRQVERLRERISAEANLGDAVAEDLDVDPMPAFAEGADETPRARVEHATPEHKLRLQRAFPGELTWL